jgi:SAM-dependent methyltransferase
LGAYCLPDHYRHRTDPEPWDDRALRDEWQREVYLIAQALMAANQWRTVFDVGCGSGFKLVTMLGGYDTLGFETPEIVDWLRVQHPDRMWCSIDAGATAKADLVLCADVIEHVVDANETITFIKSLMRKDGLAVISTPDRDLYGLPRDLRLGPPINKSHVREWSFDEFEGYMATHFTVLGHLIANRQQTTQAVIVRAR